MTLNVDVVSDIHVDIWAHYASADDVDVTAFKNDGSNVLVIAGDTGNDVPDTIAFIRDKCLPHYDQIIFIDGNHEHYNYNGHVEDAMDALRKFADETPGVDYLRGSNSVKVGNTLFVGANGWYDFRIGEPNFTVRDAINAWMQGSNDSRYISTRAGGRMDIYPEALCDTQVGEIEKVVTDAQDDDDSSQHRCHYPCISHSEHGCSTWKLHDSIGWSIWKCDCL